MKCFILDDEIDKEPRIGIVKALKDRHTITITRDRYEAEKVYKPEHDLLLLDHDMRGFYDLSSHPTTAFHFVKWLVTVPHKKKPRVILHSQNGNGRQNQLKVLHEAGFKVDEFAFCSAYVKHLEEL
jgi:hypothetical protein